MKRLLPILTVLFLAAAAQAADMPVELSAKDSIAWRKSDKTYVASGDAEATKGDTHLHANSLTAEYRETETGGTEVYQVTARESARFSSRGLTGSAGQILYRADKNLVIMTEAPLVLDSNTAHITASRKITLHESPRRVDLDGQARIQRKTDDTIMTANQMTALFSPGENGQDELSEIHAVGNVTLVSGKLASLSDEATYNMATDEVVLVGHVKITREDSQLGGDRAIINLTTGDSRILAAENGEDRRVRALFLPTDNDGENAP
ncbi:MAG: hypothetical protein A2018_00355 [Alphaproteobacteria bacterium GWF2_58_20]|nr:MAG: hypothetical protein A2018_00355 [Alphaproteobacteria bacterium GWF2_58_20]